MRGKTREMAWFEYTDMFERAQQMPATAAPYRMLTIDIEDSKQIVLSGQGYDGYALDGLIEEIVSLLDEDGIYLFPDLPYTITWAHFECGYFSLGDMRSCCIDELALRERLGIGDDEVGEEVEDAITDYLQGVLDMAMGTTLFPHDMHWEHGRFETFDWALGSVKYAAAHAPQQLESISKRSNKMAYSVA